MSGWLWVLLPVVLPPLINQIGEALREWADRRHDDRVAEIARKIQALDERLQALEARG